MRNNKIFLFIIGYKMSLEKRLLEKMIQKYRFKKEKINYEKVKKKGKIRMKFKFLSMATNLQ